KSEDVVYENNDPGLEKAPSEVDEEKAFDVDVPELVRSAAFVSGTRRPGYCSSSTAEALKEAVDVVRADGVDLTSTHFRRDSFRVPIRVQPDGDDDGVDPRWDADPQTVWSAGSIDEA